MRHDVQTIAFTKSRVAAELIYRYTRERLENDPDGFRPTASRPIGAATFRRSGAPSSGASSTGNSAASSRRTRSNSASTWDPSTPR